MRTSYYRRDMRLTRAGSFLSLIALALGVAACAGSSSQTGSDGGGRQPTATSAPTATNAATATSSSGYPVQVYFSKHPDSDNSPTAVFAV